jgi:hypothetical protein
MTPFGAPFDAYYRTIFVGAIKKAGLSPLRADDMSRPGVIVDQIWRGINQARVCLADVTGRNANVMYELGLAHAVGKPVVQVVQDIEDLPFDLRSLRHVVYRTEAPRWRYHLANAIRRMLTATLEEPASALALDPSARTGRVSDAEARESALILTCAPDEASHRMKRVLASSFAACRTLGRQEALDEMVRLGREEINRALSDSEMESFMKPAVAGRMERMLTEFTIRSLRRVEVVPWEILSEVIDEWTPSPTSKPVTESESSLVTPPTAPGSPSAEEESLPDHVQKEIESGEEFESMGDVWSAARVYASVEAKLREMGKDTLANEMNRRARKNRSFAAQSMRGDT